MHKNIGDCIDNNFKDYARLSSECGGKHNLPLFLSNEKSNKTEFCNVDILLIKNEKIKVIIEIEESDDKPVHYAVNS